MPEKAYQWLKIHHSKQQKVTGWFWENCTPPLFVFLQIDLSRGFVVGMEEEWGSQKSSLVNLALEELSQQKSAPRVVRFAHWLVGNRDELLANFFRISSRSFWRPCQPPKGKRQKRYWGSNLCWASIIGVPHPDFGETVVGVIIADGDNAPDLETIKINIYIHKSLARFKHPQRLVILPELPRNAMGKFQKNALWERFEKLFL